MDKEDAVPSEVCLAQRDRSRRIDSQEAPEESTADTRQGRGLCSVGTEVAREGGDGGPTACVCSAPPSRARRGVKAAVSALCSSYCSFRHFMKTKENKT